MERVDIVDAFMAMIEREYDRANGFPIDWTDPDATTDLSMIADDILELAFSVRIDRACDGGKS